MVESVEVVELALQGECVYARIAHTYPFDMLAPRDSRERSDLAITVQFGLQGRNDGAETQR
ncbi:hypothetical protein GCM10007898_06820 [Dyella flagellata]|uniref:TonB C-terminal domain-containing protein n=1 Tax=Dyella flagellata TaxID=1867833 RepID=A0ABQ5X671_9GAMM|nr:hypothetical protein GCM10007898_06820 [Dyella flagellata]